MQLHTIGIDLGKTLFHLVGLKGLPTIHPELSAWSQSVASHPSLN
jgi:hypothetical protein